MLSGVIRPPWMIRTRSTSFVILVGVFIGFTALVVSGATFAMDDGAIRYFKTLQGDPSIDGFIVILTAFGDVSTLFVFGILITIIRRTRKVGMVFLIALVVLVVLVMYTKPVLGRLIPPYGFEPSLGMLEDFSIENDSLAPFAAAFSYPSGHASRAAAVAFIVGFAVYNKSKKAGYALWAFPVIIGVTRLYVMQHYPTDIIGGIVFGTIVSVVLANAMKLDQPFFMSRFKGREDSKAPGDTLQR
jgi:undecaprenyl-diphosphatase